MSNMAIVRALSSISNTGKVRIPAKPLLAQGVAAHALGADEFCSDNGSRINFDHKIERVSNFGSPERPRPDC